MADCIEIVVSKLAPNYGKWLRWLDADLRITDLYSMEPLEAEQHVRNASGILLTGGSDIHSALYNRDQDIGYCRNIDDKRDRLEFSAVELAIQLRIPLFGICRGQQLLNVARKGTLYPDIQSFYETKVIHGAEEDVYHTVNISEGSQLHRISGITTGEVNSAHHQAIARPGKDVHPVAFGPDMIIEAIEHNEMSGYFCMAVQWHPERMDFEHPLSGKLGRAFISAARRKTNG